MCRQSIYTYSCSHPCFQQREWERCQLLQWPRGPDAVVPTLPEACPDLEKVWWTVRGLCGKCKIEQLKRMANKGYEEAKLDEKNLNNASETLETTTPWEDNGFKSRCESSSNDTKKFYPRKEQQGIRGGQEVDDSEVMISKKLEPEIINTPWGQRLKKQGEMGGYLPNRPFYCRLILHGPEPVPAEYLGYQDIQKDDRDAKVELQETVFNVEKIACPRRLYYFLLRLKEPPHKQIVRLLGPAFVPDAESDLKSDDTGSTIVLARNREPSSPTQSWVALKDDRDIQPPEGHSSPQSIPTSITVTPPLKRTRHERWVRGRFVPVNVAEAERIDELAEPCDRQAVLASLPRNVYEDPEKVNRSRTLEEGRDILRSRRRRERERQKRREIKKLERQVGVHVDNALRSGDAGKIKEGIVEIGKDMEEKKVEKKLKRKRKQSVTDASSKRARLAAPENLVSNPSAPKRILSTEGTPFQDSGLDVSADKSMVSWENAGQPPSQSLAVIDLPKAPEQSDESDWSEEL